MDWWTECAAVIPCLNEAAAIGPVVQKVRSHVATVFVIDDGSTDRTHKFAAEAGAEVLRHELPRGKGAALRTGLTCAFERGFSWGLTLDGDGQHAPEDIPTFLGCAEKARATLIIGNRMVAADRMPWLRRTINRWMSNRLSVIAGKTLPDSQCGFRLVNLKAWSALSIHASHFEVESEMLIAFVRAGHGVEFVPVRVIYKDEQSKIHPLRDTLRWLRWWLGLSRIEPTPTRDSMGGSSAAVSEGPRLR